jgi:hypothetical protein
MVIYRSKDNDGNLDTEPAPRTLSGRQPSHNPFNLKTSPICSNFTANERDNNNVVSNDQDDISGTPNSEAGAVSAVDLSRPAYTGHE